jgi:cobalamin biosynthesis Mg chelatase CobN
MTMHMSYDHPQVWLGVQPLLGLEGDPMRLLFQRDLTPHPQFIAFYKWLEQVRSTNLFITML